ncbi:MAG: type II toxin-antitoxin system HicB family antitoxin [Verrucomicrobiota bacterium]
MTVTAVVYYESESKLFVAECPQIGTASQGATEEEALANLKEATELYLESFPDAFPKTEAHVTTLNLSYA